MRILVGHNYYQQPGGEDAVFRSQTAMLKDFGHEVCLYERHNNEIKSDVLSLAVHAASLRFSKSSYDQMRSLIRTFKPDVAHFHNTFFVMTPAVLYACKDEGVPVVVSLHNFRPMCLNGLFFRDGKPCEDCLHGPRISGIIHRCYRGSLVFSAIAADMTDYHWRRKTWGNIVDRFVVATEFSREKYIQAGVPPEKMTVLPHFAEEPPYGFSGTENRGDYALYAGRLSQEKGVDILLRAWRNIKGLPLYIIGTGPKQKEMETYIKAQGLTHVKMLGFSESHEYLKILSRAKFLVVPSVCYENFPRVVADAYACGVPVLANRIGTMEEIVEDGNTGLLFSDSDPQDLAAKAMEMVRDENKYAQLCANARRVYDLKYTPRRHYEGLMDIYQGMAVHVRRHRQTVSKKIKILICGVLPPPNFGHSMVYKMLMASSFPDAFETKFLNMQFWTYGTHNKVTIEKLFKMVKYYVIFTGILIFWRPAYVLYNSSFYRLPFLKDFLFCSTGILLGSRIVFHDLGQYVKELDRSLTGLKKTALRWMLRNMGGSIIMGENVRQDYEGLADPAKLFVVPGTAEDSKEIVIDSPKIPGVINVLYFSHMSRLKGVYTAFEALSFILKERADVMVTFSGPLEDQEVKSRLEELQKNFFQRVRYVEYVEDVVERTKIFRQADIFIFPTLRDVFGLVLLHAMAEGLPIVASREGAIPEIVPDQTNAFLIEKGDAKALADKILLLAGDRHLREKMGQANRRRFEETYTLEKYGETIIKAFNQMEALYGR